MEIFPFGEEDVFALSKLLQYESAERGKRGGGMTETLMRALSVAITNLSLEYPGLGFMMDDGGTWRVLMPDDVQIPVSGGFGIGGE